MNNIYIIEEQPNPSTDYYVLPAIKHTKLNVIQCGFRDLPNQEALSGATIIFVRYVPQTWVKLIEASRNKIKKIIFFMDDDVLDVCATKTMPWHYRLKLFRLSSTKSWWLKKNSVQLWVSTPYLLKKYAEWNPTLILPSSISYVESCRVFYHGSLTHKAEIRWLRPIIEEVLKKDERISFEIVGEKDTFNLYKGLPRITTIHPMKWPAYQTFTSRCKGYIGLAPLLNIPFNKARSYNKFLDFTRCDSVGIYSENSECAAAIRDTNSGIIIPMNPELWIRNIIDLTNDHNKRKLMLDNAKKRIIELDQLANKEYSNLEF